MRQYFLLKWMIESPIAQICFSLHLHSGNYLSHSLRAHNLQFKLLKGQFLLRKYLNVHTRLQAIFVDKCFVFTLREY